MNLQQTLPPLPPKEKLFLPNLFFSFLLPPPPKKKGFLPVLSEQKTETQPKVSTASILRTMTL